jgi:hypothetical protein
MELRPPHWSARFAEATSNFGWTGAFWAFAMQVAIRKRRKVFTGAFSANHYCSFSLQQKGERGTACAYGRTGDMPI